MHDLLGELKHSKRESVVFFCGRRVIMVTDGDGRRVSTIVQLTRVRQFAKQNFAADWIIVCMMHGL